MKKFLLLLITICFISASSVAYARTFSDIRSPVLDRALNYLYHHDILSGYPDGTFKPDKTINRAEALKIIFLSLYEKIDETAPKVNPFPDVDKSQWFAPYVMEAKKRGLIKGYKDNTYKPTQFVNKVEFIKMTMLAQSYYEAPSDYSDLIKQFSDITDPNEWYIPTLSFAFKNNFLSKSSKFKPTSGMTRGEAALIIYNVAETNEGIVYKIVPCTEGEMCVNGVDLSKYDWVNNKLVKIKDGKLFINGRDYSNEIELDSDPNDVLRIIEREELATTPIETKMRVDEIYPELYERAIGIHGGLQCNMDFHGTDDYLTNRYLNKIIRNKDGKTFHNCECYYEGKIIGGYDSEETKDKYFNGGTKTPFEIWIKTDEAKPFIYDIAYWQTEHPEYYNPDL